MTDIQPAEQQVNLHPRVRYRAVGEDGVLIHMDHGRVVVVNEVGLHIVHSLEKPTTLERLTRNVVSEFEVTWEHARSDTESFLAEMEAEELLMTEIASSAGSE
jgi:hypothetical protein